MAAPLSSPEGWPIGLWQAPQPDGRPHYCSHEHEVLQHKQIVPEHATKSKSMWGGLSFLCCWVSNIRCADESELKTYLRHFHFHSIVIHHIIQNTILQISYVHLIIILLLAEIIFLYLTHPVIQTVVCTLGAVSCRLFCATSREQTLAVGCLLNAPQSWTCVEVSQWPYGRVT